MEDGRQYLGSGSRLTLGNTEYRIINAVGSGSNAIVYKAVYQDGVEKQYCHYVLIKELFPRHQDRGIYRGSDGRICRRPEQEEYFRMHERSFRTGNEIHLSCLAAHPEAAAGNINSWYMNGTIYTVYPFDGGITLEQYRNREHTGLHEICLFMEELADVVKIFHDTGFLHLDISPDNILIIPMPGKTKYRLLLIDYNCAWKISAESRDNGLYTGKKEGYSAPEVMLGRTEYFGRASDLYSVCAVLFYLLTGRKLTRSEQTNRKELNRALDNCPCLENIPVTAFMKLRQILGRGLSQSPAVRYQECEELKNDLREWLDRIEGRGITRAALWEAGRRQRLACEKQMRAPNYKCSMHLRTEQMEEIDEETFQKEAGEGNVLLLGEGGAGKTGMLLRIWKRYTEYYDEHMPVPVYVPLAACTGDNGTGDAIRRYILEKLRPDSRQEAEEMTCLNRLLESDGKFLFLLDGLDEAGHRKHLTYEIRELTRKKGTAVILTERNAAPGRKWRTDFRIYEVIGLSREQQRRICAEKNIPLPERSDAGRLLSNRMFMGMYLDIMASESSDERTEGADEYFPVRVRDLFDRYFISIEEKLERILQDDDEYCAARFALEHFLPAAASQCEKAGSLSTERIMHTAEKCYSLLQDRAFLFAFPEYARNGARIRGAFPDIWQWYDFAVNRLLSDILKLLADSDGRWTVSHQELCVYLAEQGKARKKTYMRTRARQRFKRNSWILAVCAGAGTAGFMIWTQISYPFFENDRAEVEDSIKNMGLVTGSAWFVIQTQYDMLDQAEDMLEEGSLEENYGNWNEQMLSGMESCEFYARLHEEASVSVYLPLAENLRLDLEQEDLEDVYTFPEKSFEDAAQYMQSLSHRLNPSAGYTDHERKNAVERYREYLDARSGLLNWTTASVLNDYPDAYRQEYEQMLREYPLYQSIRAEEEEIRAEKENMEKALEDAEREMRLGGM